MDPALTNSLRLAATSLAIGLLIGIERERKGDSRGVRTFALISLFGFLVAAMAERMARPELLAVGLGVLGLIAVSAYWHDYRGQAPEGSAPAEPPTTSVVAMTVTGCLGFLCGLSDDRLAVPMAIVVASLLYFKSELEGLAGRIRSDDLIPVLQFGALTFIIMPLLPDHAYGPNGSLNPHDMWRMVVLVAGVGLTGYFALRFAGPRYGAPLAAVAGGLVSSTATTLVFARHSRTHASAPMLALLVLLCNFTMLLRLVAMAAVIQPALVPGIGLLVGAALAAAMAVGLWLWPQAIRAADLPMPQVDNPTQLRVALGFGLAYGLVSLLAAVGAERAGRGALYLVAALSGLTDVDAISLSSFRMFGAGSIEAGTAVAAVGIAVIASMLFKTAMVFSSGSRAMARLCSAGFLAMAAAIGAAILLV